MLNHWETIMMFQSLNKKQVIKTVFSINSAIAYFETSFSSAFKAPPEYSFSIDDGDAENDALWKTYLYFTLECRNCVDLFSSHIGLKSCSG